MNIQTDTLRYNHYVIKNPIDVTDLSMKHSHNAYELIFCEKGDVLYGIENRKYVLKKNTLVFTRPFHYHYLEFTSNTEYSRFNIHFDSSIISKDVFDKIPSSLEVLYCSNDDLITGIFKRLDYYSNSLSEQDFTDILGTLIKELLYNLTLSPEKTPINPFKTSPLLTEILNYINENLFTIKDVKDVCAHFFICQQYFFRLFQSQLKITPRKYLNSKRLSYAQKMLQQGKKPSEVYLSCGFESYVGFYKQYLKTFGYPPSQEKLIPSL